MQAKSFFKTFRIIHASLCLTLIGCTAFVFVKNGDFKASTANDFLVFIVPTTAMIAYFGSTWMYQKLLRNIPKTEKLSKKLQAYFSASIAKYALIEGAAFLGLFGYYYSGNAIHLVITICLIVYLIFQRPTLTKIMQEVPLNLDEKKEFDTLKSE